MSNIGVPALSPQALSAWAKSMYRGDPDDHRYLQLWQHMLDTKETALLVWEQFLPPHVRDVLVEDIGDEASARVVLAFVAMSHDVGKASPAFAVQCPYLGDRMRESGLSLKESLAKDELRSQYRHELVGFASMIEWMRNRGLVVTEGSMAYGLASIIAGHHGSSLTREKRKLLKRYGAAVFLGDQPWEDARQELLNWAAEVTGFASLLESSWDRPLRRRTLILLTAVVIMSDWIASDAWNFPLNESEVDEQCFDARARAHSAWRSLDLPSPWEPKMPQQTPDALFAERFDIPGAQLRPMQREVVKQAMTMEGPGLMIVEANMGEGKTEAALTAAEILAARFGYGGIYYALPTQATVNAMFHRALEWIRHLPAEEGGLLASVFLAQAKREQNTEYVDLRDGSDDRSWQDAPYLVDMESGEASTRGVSEDDRIHAVVNAWLSGRKRGNLSDFVIGTIDQVLMAALQSKHVVLRHLSLAGKVVILDEIHSNTAYMDVYMTTALSWLGSYGASVIMLSATLPESKRKEYLHAYRRGASAVHAIEALPTSQSAMSNDVVKLIAPGFQESESPTEKDWRYPLISSVTADSESTTSVEPSGRSSRVELTMLDDDDTELVQMLRQQLQDGGAAVVIRNTVSRAQHTYDVLKAEFGNDIEVMLDHSRFLACDRASKDTNLIKRFGRSSVPEQRNAIVVATQVVEQSLDVDFDVMISDIAPVDLLLQRMGRLHRHHRGQDECERPEPLRQARLYITGIKQWSPVSPPLFATGIEHVYQRFFLIRTMAILNIAPGETTVVTTPDDIPRLVQTVYDTEHLTCPAAWESGSAGERAARDAMLETRKNSESTAQQFGIFPSWYEKRPFSLGFWLSLDIPDPDGSNNSQSRKSRASVREGDDTFEVLVLQQDDDRMLRLPTWVDASANAMLSQRLEELPKELVRNILSCSISLGRPSLAYQDEDSVIDAFEQAAPETWFELMQQNRELRGQLPLILDSDANAIVPITVSKNKKGECTVMNMHVHYSSERGWQAHVVK